MAPRRFADVALPLPLESAFTYAIPESLQSRIQVGMRAVIPFHKRIETGYIVGLHDNPPSVALRKIIDLPDSGPIFAGDLIKLCTWVAEYYCCSLGEALHCAVPAGIRIRSKMRYAFVPEAIATGRYTERQRTVIAALHRRGPLTEGQLAKEAGRTALSNTLQSLVRRGVLLAEPVVGQAGVSMRTELWAILIDSAIPEADTLAAIQRRAPKQAAVYLDLLHGDPQRVATELYQRHSAKSTLLRSLESKGLIRLEQRELYRSPNIQQSTDATKKFVLNDEQQSAYETITQSLHDQRFQTILLKGITGSGKTEVYLQAIEIALELGRDAIVLVPEISLTPQTVGRFLARFDTRIAVLHSGLAAGERYDEWRRAQRGEVRIVVGARSAVFAPLPNLGLIVVDEEHDTSYKQSETPRYHARDVAIMRAKLSKGTCVLGSATPSIESYFNSEKNKSIRVELNQRATAARLPEVQLLDMRTVSREHGGNVIIAPRLEEEVRKRVALGEQTILLLNRRGHSPFVLCPQCAWVAECNDCQVSLTYHAKGGHLACHYCNAQREVPQVCDQCHFNPLIFLGTGTQKIEDYLLRTFSDARIERMDRDTTAGKGGHAKILGRFAQGEIDILIGTQMIAKGHDYPGVTLVGVINADTGLAIPDFRGAEQVFQLLTQVAGRAGRGDKAGAVFVQTYRPSHYAVKSAASHDFEGFYRHEIIQRDSAGYPPFRRLVQFTLECADPQEAQRFTARLHRIIREQIEELGYRGVEILGPAPASVRRVKKMYRWNIGAFSKSAKRLNKLARNVRVAFAEIAPSKVQLKVDLDPYGMF